jgi:hypothetical protein
MKICKHPDGCTKAVQAQGWCPMHYHKNGVRHDNRPENLELWCVPQPCGQRAIDLAQWVIDAYPELINEARSQRRMTDETQSPLPAGS